MNAATAHPARYTPVRMAAALPIDFAALAAIGWRESDLATLPPGLESGCRVARVIAQHRSGYEVHDGASAYPVQAPAQMVRAGVEPRSRPAVGDWVVLAPKLPPLIQILLPRRTLLARAAAGESHREQPIAANIDVVLVVCGLDHDYNPRRIERYLVLVQGSGAQPVVVLTKRDLCAEADARRDEIVRMAGPAVAVQCVNAKDPQTIDQLRPYLGPGITAVLVGSSGAGKSTLTNRLLGIEKQRTNDVRGNDSRGRHTTTHRALIPLPTGACLIDTPGMREIKLTGDEDLAATHFADIEALGTQCRFTDCQHRTEPGCRVLAAVASGELDAVRYAHYEKLRAELLSTRTDPAAQRQRKAAEKQLGRALGKRLTEKYGSR